MKSSRLMQWALRGIAVLTLSLSLSACFHFTIVSHKQDLKASRVEAASIEVQQALAPTGILRVGVYAGSPTSLVKETPTGESVGIALDLGKELAKRLNVPVQVIEYQRVAQVLDALKNKQVDFTFTNSTALRAKDVDFTQAMLRLELGYLVVASSPIRALTEIDQPSTRVGVSQGSSSQGVLTQTLQKAKVVTAESLNQAQAMLTSQQIDAFATNKGILFEMSDALPGSRVLEGRWGLENLAIAIPKGRDTGGDFVQSFANELVKNGSLDKAIQRSGLRGVARD